jgi:hypothetical protein
MHLMPRLLEFTPFVGELVGDYELPAIADGRDFICQVVGYCVISTTLCKMPKDLIRAQSHW